MVTVYQFSNPTGLPLENTLYNLPFKHKNFRRWNRTKATHFITLNWNSKYKFVLTLLLETYLRILSATETIYVHQIID